LKTKQTRLIPIGCPAHILHNAAKQATEQLSFDIESIAFKLQSHFKGSTKRHEALKELFESVEVSLQKLKSLLQCLGMLLEVAILRSDSLDHAQSVFGEID
jgi:DNA polymerase I-like protein with 3'-5' exonuclease and polymerase domains